VCVPPFGGVQGADVVAAHETDLIIDDKELAVIQPSAAKSLEEH
jgi:hypothetical protein